MDSLNDNPESLNHFPADPSTPDFDTLKEKYKFSDFILFGLLGIITLVNISFCLYIIFDKYL